MYRFHRLTVIALAVLAPLCLCGASGAATTIGSDLRAAPESACTSVTGCTATTQSSGSGRPLAAPADGVLLRFRIRHGPTAPGAAYTLKVLSGSGSIVGGLTSFTLVRQFGPYRFDSFSTGGIDVVPAGVRISAGQRIGVFVPGGVGFQGAAPGSASAEHDADHTTGAAPYSIHSGYESLISADVQPDAGGRPAAPQPLAPGAPAGYVKPRIGRTRARRPLSGLVRAGVPVPITCHGPCTARATLAARRGSGRSVAVGRGRRRSAAGGRFRLTVRLSRNGTGLLRRLRPGAGLRLRVSAADEWGSSSRRQTIRLIRR